MIKRISLILISLLLITFAAVPAIRIGVVKAETNHVEMPREYINA